jgi:ABC-type proline/glycine betaine transport system ATPase subunit
LKVKIIFVAHDGSTAMRMEVRIMLTNPAAARMADR